MKIKNVLLICLKRGMIFSLAILLKQQSILAVNDTNDSGFLSFLSSNTQVKSHKQNTLLVPDNYHKKIKSKKAQQNETVSFIKRHSKSIALFIISVAVTFLIRHYAEYLTTIMINKGKENLYSWGIEGLKKIFESPAISFSNMPSVDTSGNGNTAWVAEYLSSNSQNNNTKGSNSKGNAVVEKWIEEHLSNNKNDAQSPTISASNMPSVDIPAIWTAEFASSERQNNNVKGSNSVDNAVIEKWGDEYKNNVQSTNISVSNMSAVNTSVKISNAQKGVSIVKPSTNVWVAEYDANTGDQRKQEASKSTDCTQQKAAIRIHRLCNMLNPNSKTTPGNLYRNTAWNLNKNTKIRKLQARL